MSWQPSWFSTGSKKHELCKGQPKDFSHHIIFNPLGSFRKKSFEVQLALLTRTTALNFRSALTASKLIVMNIRTC